jgi:hypothetical protein
LPDKVICNTLAVRQEGVISCLCRDKVGNCEILQGSAVYPSIFLTLPHRVGGREYSLNLEVLIERSPFRSGTAFDLDFLPKVSNRQKQEECSRIEILKKETTFVEQSRP